MIDKENQIEEMSNIISEYDDCEYLLMATALYNTGYGNITQALTDFVNKLNERLEKDTDNIARDYDIMRYKKITTIVNETLEEFKNGYKI